MSAKLSSGERGTGGGKERSAQVGLDAIAITDHDAMGGVSQALDGFALL
jgi:predicted metal-dependent phosphoesterase TrpH